MLQKLSRRQCNQNKVAITVGVGKHNGEKIMTLEFEISSLNVQKYIC